MLINWMDDFGVALVVLVVANDSVAKHGSSADRESEREREKEGPLVA